MDYSREVRSILALLFFMSVLCILIAYSTGLYNPEYSNFVWGEVEDVQHMSDLESYDVTVIYTVDDEEYAGTYRGKFTSKYKYSIGECVLLSASSTYKFITPYKDTPEGLETVQEPLSIGVSVFKCIGTLSAVFLIISYLVADVDWSSLNRDKDKDTKCILKEHISELKDIINEVKAIAKECDNNIYKAVLLETVMSMQERLKVLLKEDKLAVTETYSIVRQHKDQLKDSFCHIRKLASETAIREFSFKDEDELQSSILQLQAYLDLSK